MKSSVIKWIRFLAKIRTRLRVICVLLWLLSCSWYCGGATANEVASVTLDTLALQTSLGFSDTVRLGRWAPLTVTVENEGDTVFGTLQVAVTSGDELAGTAFTTTWERALELTRDARKRFDFTVYIDNISAPVEVGVVSGNQIVARQTIDLRQKFTDSRLLVVLSRHANLDYLNEQSSGRIRVTYPHPGMLPVQWQGYDGVTALIVHGVTLEQWSARQYDALKKWVDQGGTLLVSGGPDYASLRTPRLAELMPALPVGLQTIDSDTDFRAALGDSFVAPRPFQIHQVSNGNGRVTLGAARLPLVIESAYGTGRVTYLTFDIGAYPFSGWPGMVQFWHKHLDLITPEAERPLPDVSASVMPALFNSSSHSFPHRLVIVSFLVAYLALLAVICHPAGKGAFGGITLHRGASWFVPLLFVPAAYGLFVTLLSPARVYAKVVSVIDSRQDGSYARLDLDLGLYSNRSDLATLELAQSSAVFLPSVDRDRPDQVASWAQRGGNPARLRVIDRHPYVLHTLRGSDLLDFDLQATVKQTPGGLDVAVQHVAHRSMEFAWLFFDEWLYPLGPVTADGNVSFQVSNDAVVSVNDRGAISNALQSVSPRELPALLTALIRNVTRYRRETPLAGNEALLVAVPARNRPVIVADSSLHTTHIELVFSRLAVTLLPVLAQEFDPENTDAR